MTKIILTIIVVIGIVVAVAVFKNKSVLAPEDGLTSNEPPVVCTQDAKECPDGSFVSRQGPNCEFAPCPGSTPLTTGGSTPSTGSPQVTPTPTPANAVKNQTVIITFADGTANPREVMIKVGDSVKFINNDDELRWPASGVHPTHQICPGFDSLRGLATGETYSFTFHEAKTCPWHDHLMPLINGKITVNQ